MDTGDSALGASLLLGNWEGKKGFPKGKKPSVSFPLGSVTDESQNPEHED
jgi:hypothetical protein